jgi:hypothetical protein
MLRRYDKVFDIFETLEKLNVEVLIVFENKQVKIIKKDKTIEEYSGDFIYNIILDFLKGYDFEFNKEIFIEDVLSKALTRKEIEYESSTNQLIDELIVASNTDYYLSAESEYTVKKDRFLKVLKNHI